MGTKSQSINPSLSLIEFLSLSKNVDKRLLNAIQFAERNNTLPYKTVEAYVNAGVDGHHQMMHIPGIGSGTIAKLDKIIAEQKKNNQSKSESINEMQYLTKSEDTLNLPLDEFLFKQKFVSVRLLNAISMAVINRKCPFDTVADYIKCDTRNHELRKIKNLGRNSANEFEKLIAHLIASPPPLIEDIFISRDFVNIGKIVREINSIFSDSERLVITERFHNKRTLESTAKIKNVTRERIRQIEAKVIRKLSNKFNELLRESAEAIIAKLINDELFELTIQRFTELFECNTAEASIYLACLNKLNSEISLLDTYEIYIFISSKFAPKENWDVILQDEILAQPIPLAVDSVIAKIVNVPSFYIRNYINRKWGTKLINNTTVAAHNYGTNRMCIEVLRRAGGPLHISDVRSRINSLFDIDITEHSITAALGRIKECTIIGIGTYVLYENLLYDDIDIENIRSVSYEYLKSKGVFLSSKILFDEAFILTKENYPADFNYYLLMGILQDDERFITKRGNMIGLTSFDPSKTFMSLQDEIHMIVLEYGPITLKEISEHLSKTRRLCNDAGIRLVLSQLQDVIRTGRQTYDSLHRFFDTRQDLNDILLAIRVSLLDKPKTTYAITQDLTRLDLAKITTDLVNSLLLSMDDIISQNGTHQLIIQDDELYQYNEIVVLGIQNGKTQKSIFEDLSKIHSSEKLEKLIYFDSRFVNEISETNLEPNDTEISSILKEFEF